MGDEIRAALNILGFEESLEKVPSLSKIRHQFRKECLVKHPDKTTGSKDKFQQLLSAYQKVEKWIAQQNRGGIQMKDISDRYGIFSKKDFPSFLACSDGEGNITSEAYFKNFNLYGN